MNLTNFWIILACFSVADARVLRDGNNRELLNWWYSKSASSAQRCGTNAEVTGGGTSCHCLPGYQGNAFTECTDINECATPLTCASNQICQNTVGSFLCQPRTCSNPYGNPCGPGGACTDAASGFTCAYQYRSNGLWAQPDVREGRL